MIQNVLSKDKWITLPSGEVLELYFLFTFFFFFLEKDSFYVVVYYYHLFVD